MVTLEELLPNSTVSGIIPGRQVAVVSSHSVLDLAVDAISTMYLDTVDIR